MTFQCECWNQYGEIMAGTSLSIIPSLALFIAVQRFIIEGVVLTGLKGYSTNQRVSAPVAPASPSPTQAISPSQKAPLPVLPPYRLPQSSHKANMPI